MKYVGNMRRNTNDGFQNHTEKAVFPPGSIIPERIKDEAVMYNQNPMQGQQQTRERNGLQETENSFRQNENAAVHQRDDYGDSEMSMHGLMDYDSMAFPFEDGQILRRSDSNMENYIGSVEDPRNFSPANGLGGRPVQNNQGMSGQVIRNRNNMNVDLKCGPGVRLSDVMCMYAGKMVDMEFMFGADTYVKKSGILSGAGMNFVILTDENTGRKTICDLTDMKFLSVSQSE